MDYRRAQADILTLLEESPLTKGDVITDVKELVYVGEIALAFDTLCSWIYEDSLAIPRPFYERLVALAVELEEPGTAQKLDELVVD